MDSPEEIVQAVAKAVDQKPPACVLHTMCDMSEMIPPGITAVAPTEVEQCVLMYEGCVQHVGMCESAHESCQGKSAVGAWVHRRAPAP